MLYLKSYDVITDELLIKDSDDSSIEYHNINDDNGVIAGWISESDYFEVSSAEMKALALLDLTSEDVHIVNEDNNITPVVKADAVNYIISNGEYVSLGGILLRAGSQRTIGKDNYYVLDDKLYLVIDASSHSYLALSYKISDMNLYKKYCLKADILKR